MQYKTIFTIQNITLNIIKQKENENNTFKILKVLLLVTNIKSYFASKNILLNSIVAHIATKIFLKLIINENKVNSAIKLLK